MNIFWGRASWLSSSKYKEWFEEYAQEQERLLAKDNTELLENGTFVYHGIRISLLL